MDRIDISKLSLERWELLIKIKRATWGLWDDIDDIEHLLQECQQERLQFAMVGDCTISHIYSQLLCWYVKKALGLWSSGRRDFWQIQQILNKYCQHNEQSRSYISEYLSLNEDRAWMHVIPEGIRYTSSHFFSRWLFGAHLMILWSQSADILMVYWIGFQLSYAPVEDIPTLWKAYEETRKAVENFHQYLLGNSWFWQRRFRWTMKLVKEDFDRYHRSVQSVVKNRLCPHEKYLDIAKMLMQDNFYPDMFHMLYDSEAISALMLNWQMFHPEWLVIYKGMSQIELTAEEQLHWRNRRYHCIQQGITGAAANGYLYHLIIDDILVKPLDMEKDTLRLCFDETIAIRPDFWYQLRDTAQHYTHSNYVECIKNYLNGWMYTSMQMKEQRWDSVEIERVPLKYYSSLLSAYDKCLPADQVKLCALKCSELSHQTSIGLNYHIQRTVQILWISVDLILSTPISYDDCYLQGLFQCFERHQYLPDDIKRHLQSYMVVLAKYVWLQRWDVPTVLYVCEKLKYVESDSWKRGVEKIVTLSQQFPHQPIKSLTMENII
jgi:hypothetical protein